jgi:hypothetical protein
MTTPAQALLEAEEADRLWKAQFPEGVPGEEKTPVTDIKVVVEDIPIGGKVTEPPLEDEPVEPVKDKSEDFKHKYDVLQGKYNAEVLGVNQRLADKDYQLQQAFAKIAALESTPKTEKVAQAKEDVVASLIQDDSFKFLEDQYPVIYNAVVTGLQKVSSATEAKLAEVKSGFDEVKNVTAKTVKDKFYDDLSREVSDWEVVNKSPEFQQWVTEKDRYSGLTRHQLLMDAYNSNDAGRAMAFFNDFKEQSKPPGQSAGTKQTQVPRDVAPPRSVGNARPREPAQQERLKSSEVDKFYSDIRKGHYIGREDEMRTLEAKIEKAIVEGRID